MLAGYSCGGSAAETAFPTPCASGALWVGPAGPSSLAPGTAVLEELAAAHQQVGYDQRQHHQAPQRGGRGALVAIVDQAGPGIRHARGHEYEAESIAACHPLLVQGDVAVIAGDERHEVVRNQPPAWNICCGCTNGFS